MAYETNNRQKYHISFSSSTRPYAPENGIPAFSNHAELIRKKNAPLGLHVVTIAPE
jgi:hypothetical protein